MNGPNVHKSLTSVFKNQSSVYDEICQHLTYLLNARQGCLVALPDYGLPELLSMFRYLPEGLYNFLKIIKQNIEQYEPRLKNVRVELSSEFSVNEVLQLNIQAEDVDHQALLFQATVSQLNGIAVIPAKV
jgi:type VI secretion system protein